MANENKPITLEGIKESQKMTTEHQKEENVQEQKEKSPYEVGQERMSKIGGFFSNICKKISGGWDRLKGMAKEIGINLFSAPELMKTGAKEIGRSAKEDVYEPGVKAAKEGAKFVGEKAKAGYEYGKDKAAAGYEYGKGKVAEGAKFVGEKAGEGYELGAKAVEAGKQYLKEDLEKTRKHLADTKESIGKDWTKTKEHGTMAIKSVQEIGRKVGETVNTTIKATVENTKTAIENKLGQLKEYTDTIGLVAEGIKDTAEKSINDVIEKTNTKISERVKELQTAIESRVTKFHESIAEFKALGEIKRKEKAEKQMESMFNKAKTMVEQKQNDLKELQAFIEKYENLKNK